MKRKLLKRDVMTLSKIFKKIELKKYVGNMMSEKMDTILADGNSINEKIGIVLADFVAHVLENVYIVENEIDDLIISYHGMTKEDIELLDLDAYVVIIKEIMIAGVPNIIGDFVDVGEIKKKIKEGLSSLDK